MEYFKLCDETKRPKTLSWLCIYLWISKDYISEKSKSEDYSETIKQIRNIVENDVEEWILTSKYNPTAWIFNLKNNFGWKDKTEVDQNVRSADVSDVLDENQKANIAKLLLNE